MRHFPYPLILSFSRKGRRDALNDPLPLRERVAAGFAGRRVRGCGVFPINGSGY